MLRRKPKSAQVRRRHIYLYSVEPCPLGAYARRLFIALITTNVSCEKCPEGLRTNQTPEIQNKLWDTPLRAGANQTFIILPFIAWGALPWRPYPFDREEIYNERESGNVS